MSKEKKNKPIVETKVISSNDKMKMVVVQTIRDLQRKNRKGEPFRISVTKHIKK